MLRLVRTADFEFELPSELIAQVPAQRREDARLLVLRRNSDQIEHRTIADLVEFLRPGEVLVLNNSRVIPARLRGENRQTGGKFEVLLLEENVANDWWVMVRPGKRARPGMRIDFRDGGGVTGEISAEVTEVNQQGHRRMRFHGVRDIVQALERYGETPLPPYITRPGAGRTPLDRERYQTVFAGPPGSVAAPTAGLHFTPRLLEALQSRGVRVCFVTLHVGLGTFAPVKTETLSRHPMHEERFEVPEETAQWVESARQSGRRVVAVGTTTVRVLESVAADHDGRIVAGRGRTRIFLYPPCRFRIVGALLTNFHLPRSTLLMLVSAFAAPGETRGRDLVLAAYAEAVRCRYRFFSYGDAMLVI